MMSNANYLQTVCGKCRTGILLSDGYMDRNRHHICKSCWDLEPSGKIHEPTSTKVWNSADINQLQSQLASMTAELAEAKGKAEKYRRGLEEAKKYMDEEYEFSWSTLIEIITKALED